MAGEHARLPLSSSAADRLLTAQAAGRRRKPHCVAS